ncbi:hypothetical protein AgCh_000585 [Apium graveolens]
MESISEAPLKLSMPLPRETLVALNPKIRIIHVLPPTIIQTDVSNFREMVQRLTGKPKPASIEPKKKLQDWDSDNKNTKKEWKVLYRQSSFGTEYFDGFLELEDGLFEQE